MGETYQQLHQHQASTSSRLGLRSSGVGEIVEVQGGHIVRSTGRKDRHSKVCTAKGPRDRRVRLSAHTAIQFYDVQDRLGYDRPSKAVDWLINKAKAAIDELAELPAWRPTGTAANAEFGQGETQTKCEDNHQDSADNQQQQLGMVDSLAGPSCKRALKMVGNEGQGLHHNSTNGNFSGSSSISFLPPSLDSDSIADTIKSFFPMGTSVEANTSGMQFQSFPPPDLLSRTSSQNQDLRLSLQSFQDPIMFHRHQHHQQAQHHNPTSHSEQELVNAQAHAAFFSGTMPVQLGFDGSCWSDQHHQHQHNTEFGRFQRLATWNSGIEIGGSASGGGGGGAEAAGGYSFNSAPGPSLLQPFFGQNQFFSQRGPLQSSNTPPVRAWMDPSAIAIATTERSQHHQHHQAMLLNYPPSISGIGLASGASRFSGFRIPARIQGDEEEQDGISDKPSSASSDSRH